MLYEDIKKNVPPAVRPPDIPLDTCQLWNMLEKCWESTPESRPTASDMAKYFEFTAGLRGRVLPSSLLLQSSSSVSRWHDPHAHCTEETLENEEEITTLTDMFGYGMELNAQSYANIPQQPRYVGPDTGIPLGHAAPHFYNGIGVPWSRFLISNSRSPDYAREASIDSSKHSTRGGYLDELALRQYSATQSIFEFMRSNPNRVIPESLITGVLAEVKGETAKCLIGDCALVRSALSMKDKSHVYNHIREVHFHSAPFRCQHWYI